MAENNDGPGGQARDPDPGIEDHVASRSTWIRGLFMLLYCAIFSLVSMVGTFVVVVGFFWVLFTGAPNRQLSSVGRSLAAYIYEVALYLTFSADERPFPFGSDWPTTTADRRTG